MRIHILIITGFLFVCAAIYSCSPDPQERAKQIYLHSTVSNNEKESIGEVLWKNENQASFTDKRDNKKYEIVKIGSQIWFAENLAYKPDSGNYWAYENDKNNLGKYGYLYFWETAKRVCPEGWHLPGNEEWDTLINFLGGRSVAGGKLKSTKGWNTLNEGVTNSSGFSAFPGGNRAFGGSFYHLGEDALFWSSTSDDTISAWKIRFNVNWDSVSFQEVHRRIGYSVRCIKD